MSNDLVIDRDFPVQAGVCTDISPLLRRVVADNPGPFTFTGTCSYIVGHGAVAIVDPGPDRPEHIRALLDAVAGETVTHVVVTHTHLDHSPAARAISAETGAPIVGCGPHRRARALGEGELPEREGSNDLAHVPAQEMTEGDDIGGTGWRLVAVATPGHTANHLAFALPQENALLSGDHVMAWSTTIVAPPDGSMTDYMASLAKLQSRADSIYWPGHGGPVLDPATFVRGLISHRREREASIIRRLVAGDQTIAAIVPAVYSRLAPALVGGAALSVYAHLEDLVARGLVQTDGPLRLDGKYRLEAG